MRPVYVRSFANVNVGTVRYIKMPTAVSVKWGGAGVVVGRWRGRRAVYSPHRLPRARSLASFASPAEEREGSRLPARRQPSTLGLNPLLLGKGLERTDRGVCSSLPRSPARARAFEMGREASVPRRCAEAVPCTRARECSFSSREREPRSRARTRIPHLSRCAYRFGSRSCA